ncbi:MAG: peptidylprolyl isomerase [Oscillospiraceae bacterium]|nr:peptidylprolyl isomerase [Oscillospiraceae bacterium]
MKKTIVLLLSVLLLVTALSACGGSKSWTGKHTVEITIKDYGTIKVDIDADTAPVTASNFLNLVKKGFYNNLTIYRAIDGFAIYGGDPNKNGTGTSGETITGEFNSNGYNNPLSNVRGAFGMARGINKNSASCQFYILQNDATYLDGDFAVFGNVISGMEIVDLIASTAQVTGSDGHITVDNQPVISSIKLAD